MWEIIRGAQKTRQEIVEEAEIDEEPESEDLEQFLGSPFVTGASEVLQEASWAEASIFFLEDVVDLVAGSIRGQEEKARNDIDSEGLGNLIQYRDFGAGPLEILDLPGENPSSLWPFLGISGFTTCWVRGGLIQYCFKCVEA